MSDAELVARLGQILATTTGLRLEDLDPEASFLELGLSSIALVDTFRAIRDTLGVRPSIRLVFEEYRTLGRLAGYIEELLARRTEAEALQSQAALVDGATAHPIPGRASRRTARPRVAWAVGAPRPSRLERAWAEMCDRHGALRARALPERDALFIDPAGSAAPIRVLTPTEAELLPAITRAATERLPLHQAAARLCLVEAGPRSHVLILVAHALVADRPSLERALVELLVLFENPRAELPPALAFAEILRRLEARAEAPETAASLQHFRERFSPRPPPLDLPTDHRRPAVKAYAGARLVRPVPPEVAVGVAEVARRVGAPSSVVVLGALAELCRRLSGTRPVVIGVHGRLDELLPPGAEAIAPLSSPLPVLIPLERGAGVRSLLEAARSALTDALDHTGVPFLRLVEALDSGRDQSRSALYAVSFDAEGERPLPALAGLALERVQLPATRCRTDLAFRWVDAALGPELVVDYSSEIFERSTVLRWVKVLIQSLAALPTTLDRSAQAWSLAAQEPAPGALSGPEPDLPLERIEAALLERGAQPTVLGSSETWSATELWERSGELARRLVHLGLRRGDRVGLSLERTPSLVAAVLGVLRAGGAYVPLDPAYPPARLAMIVETLVSSRSSRIIRRPGPRRA
jgi:acyl carrier protein